MRHSADAGVADGVGCSADAAALEANSVLAVHQSASFSAGGSGGAVVVRAQHLALAAVPASTAVASAPESVAVLLLALAIVAPEAKSLSRAH